MSNNLENLPQGEGENIEEKYELTEKRPDETKEIIEGRRVDLGVLTNVVIEGKHHDAIRLLYPFPDKPIDQQILPLALQRILMRQGFLSNNDVDDTIQGTKPAEGFSIRIKLNKFEEDNHINSDDIRVKAKYQSPSEILFHSSEERADFLKYFNISY